LSTLSELERLVNSCAKYFAWYGVSFIAGHSPKNGPTTIAAVILAPVEDGQAL
jgi:hypothetical protein